MECAQKISTRSLSLVVSSVCTFTRRTRFLSFLHCFCFKVQYDEIFFWLFLPPRTCCPLELPTCILFSTYCSTKEHVNRSLLRERRDLFNYFFCIYHTCRSVWLVTLWTGGPSHQPSPPRDRNSNNKIQFRRFFLNVATYNWVFYLKPLYTFGTEK